MDKTLKWAIIGGIALVAGSVAYYLVLVVPSESKAQTAYYHQQQMASCLKQANDKYEPITNTLTQALLKSQNESDSKVIGDELIRKTNAWKEEKAKCQ